MPTANRTGTCSADGGAYLVFGSATGIPANRRLADLTGADGVRIDPERGTGAAGSSVDGAGDFNGDGVDDVIIGAPFTGEFGGAYVVFGRRTGFDATLSRATLDGHNGVEFTGAPFFKIEGPTGSFNAGRRVAGIGDLNGDGIDDVAVGDNGGSFVIFGRRDGFGDTLDLSALDGSDGFRFVEFGVTQFFADDPVNGDVNGDGSYSDSLGFTVSGLGDMNGDGLDDLLIFASESGSDNAPGAIVLFGRTTGFTPVQTPEDLDPTTGFVIVGAAEMGPGFDVARAGDVNGDGFADVILGTPEDGAAGAAYVVYGFATEGVRRLRGGDGADLFAFGARFGADWVFDFADGVDRLDFRGHGGVDGLADLAIRSLGRSVVIEDGAGGRLVLSATALAEIDAGDFLF